MDYDKIYGGKYLKADDLNGETLRLEIGKVVETPMKQKDGTTQTKWVIMFRKEEKGLPLNKTNASALAKSFGKIADDWIGELVDLCVESTTFGDGIRVKPVMLKSDAKQVKEPDDDMGGDQVPF